VRAQITIRNRRSEAGVALLISIFILLLISVVAIALIVASGTESSLAGNYRSATGVYYAALAGLEEARGRLSPKNANSFANTAPANFQLSPLPIGYVDYVLNPGPTEAAANILTTYPDTEYNSEFGPGKLASATVTTTLSMWDSNPLKTSLNLPGPLYKWVRINAVSEQSLNNLDTYPYDGTFESTPVYYDGTRLTDVPSSNPQVLEITALAVLPNGSQKLLQYLAAPTPIQLPPFLAALTLSGSSSSGAAFSSPNTNTAFYVSGNDQDCSGAPIPGSTFAAIGVLNSSDVTAVKSGGNGGGGIQPSSTQPNYTGLGSAPDVDPPGSLFPFPASFQSPSQLDAVAQSIIQNADAVISPTPPNTPPYLGTAYASDLHTATTTAGMSSSNPVTVVINGNLDISNWGSDGYGQGYGLLLVTGTFTYDPDTTWNGIILVIGQGIITNTQHGGTQQLNGGVFVAKTRGPGPSFSLLSALGGASVKFDSNMQGNGMRYSSCWIQKAQPKGKYKILSFHEISQ
jgi:hypothetical protein